MCSELVSPKIRKSRAFHRYQTPKHVIIIHFTLLLQEHYTPNVDIACSINIKLLALQNYPRGVRVFTATNFAILPQRVKIKPI